VREANQGSSFGGAVSRVHPRLTEGVCLHSKTAPCGLLICKKITKNKNRRDLSGKKTYYNNESAFKDDNESYPEVGRQKWMIPGS
jgi:hypothetical protein